MKTTTLFLLFYLLCFLGMSIFIGCGDTEDTKETIPSGLIAEQTEDTDNRIKIPHNWYKTRDPNLRNDYFLAILINQFGDIPEVHTIAAYQQKQIQGIPVTIDERTAYLEAHVRLWPSGRSQETLKDHKKFREMTETEDPEVFAKLFREYLIKRFGDIPEVHIVVEVEKKFKANEVVPDDKYLTYLKARFLLFPNADTLREIQEVEVRLKNDDK